MSEKLLGEHFDIHGGGQDLQFPHHENEIAQSEGAHGHPFVNYWMHNGFVRVDDEKMSKSLGNFFTVREVLEKFAPEVVRFFMLRAHYRSPLNYSDQHLTDAKQSLTRLYIALKDVAVSDVAIDWGEPRAQRFKEAMDDDFNTPEALAVLFEIANDLNRSRSPEHAGLLKALGGVLGLLQQNPVLFLQAPIFVEATFTVPIDAGLSATGGLLIERGTRSVAQGLTDDTIATLIKSRSEARKAKNFAEADRIRQQLLDAGIVLEDKAGGVTEWRRA
jgi:cysteinyl-tRNA synthetase